ncbi:MAG: hypothetical protein IRZ07_03900 [Microbispora sp.]|nr:hypothetical protein [Microbispora sp.]
MTCLGISPENVGARLARLLLDEATEIVVAAVERHRRKGLAAAYYEAARELGITERRVRQYWHREVSPTAVAAWEIEAFRAARQAALRREMAEAEHRLAMLRAMMGGQGIAADDKPGARARRAARGVSPGMAAA